MATLKMYTNDGNHIWLPNVKRVEQMFFINAEENVDCWPTEEFPWEVAQRSIERLKEHNPRLHGIVEQRIQTYDNKSALNRAVKNMEVLYVVLDGNHADVRPQNWIVQTGQNYLLENGKTIDRI